MIFCPWYPLAQAAEHTPAHPGMFQIRVRTGLVSYPKGRSAMVHYGRGDDVAAEVRGFAAAHPGRDWLCRHAPQVGDEAIAEAGSDEALRAAVEHKFEQLYTRFRQRFGTPPRPPED
ncbi:hypothetical protein [Haliangium ochraceum]|uniref:Uncharacterized protein n=1 Tax=Haliangium ochraceum (strain DSM 14365 / JCM 11303 / SMP-2) TaxID=502025 RepID=D0LIL0_HALO1|nr:hypothetical protein [Haliangium ochraceum]ACY18366.1 hypothetical protein Hoch_5891 [Haliangium ochraceum DSM 14365]